MNFKRGTIAAVAAGAALTLTLSACGSEESSGASGSSAAAGGSGVQCDGKLQLKGSGSTAQANAMTVFKNTFAQDCSGANVDYSGNGSGQGITEFTSGLTNFGGSDSPLNADQAKKAEEKCGAPALNLPLVFGPIAVAYKLPGDVAVNLSAPTLAKIFSGAITTWNAPEIAEENKGATLPDLPITVVFRSDESGTTENFQKYLGSAAPAEWSADKKGKAFKGGTGQGASGNAAVAATVNKAEGTITYAEWSFAKAQKLQVANIITSAGPEAVKLSSESVAKTIEAAKFKNPGSKDLVIDTEGFYKPTAAGAYPIVLATYEIVCSKYSDAELAKGIKTFLKVAASKPAQDQLDGQGYAPIPDSFRTTLLASVDSIQ
ncbi:Phosphate-binding protein OS=Tsukamurella paurometabola (strain ATCC 8368 / DSM / CCUG 35730/ CIP 100753 / JCM 10117 / KCTC 9821 / NBRC 16120 / NCIMB 702349/ NCTC 13040) OX=521096 GN=Tpau_3543 PE=3 SV=1 [Tsukamurella paurometabola]|uniref:Phosphate-binding protein n=1 Tax=Tsukamurella paurometabola (strain ATCC 8368 / DSM 20162 / CCUG 35730 / CIP 100753 / JCM 10117 / KCTC 9821 / NBRC 16120 / NCIMB 702349 / NCTC 13040) TaxID=521096 RepID=D5UXA3_TSUPD|nr:phosphate ABC transporter substrate-binding protein PstS [Tsukamurella paurometabola]ADG80122.1 phosphate ABC transporter, periplasmic phosphate- binding protein [Tsukamurella paurometabola DSM 20162]SUP38494.1 Antigen Ag88 [Tsukamurella paurometabola]